MMKNFHNCTPVLFGYEEYIGYVGECTHNGYKQKGVMFWKENYIICLTVISNDNLEEKFNKFTNSFKTIKSREAPKQKLVDTVYTDSIAIQEELIVKAEAKGFKRGIIQHCLNTKWDEFGDREHYSFIKTLKSGIKLYRAKMDKMMMEVYVQNGYIKIQSYNFILHDQTKQVIKEIDAWLMSCKPISVEGDIADSKVYNFDNYDATLKNGEIGICYMIAYNADNSSIENKTTTDTSLERLYSNEYFSINYPTSWQIVQDDNKATNRTSISVQIMEKQKNGYDFRPNINIIVSKKKWREPTSYLVKNSVIQSKKIMNTYHLLNQRDDVCINKCNGSLVDYTFNIQGNKLHGIQYIVKKEDNTTFIITATTDAGKHSSQNTIIKSIINSLIIK